MTSADSPIVLVVDDDTRMRSAMQRLLKTVGLHSESFATAEEFLPFIRDGFGCGDNLHGHQFPRVPSN